MATIESSETTTSAATSADASTSDSSSTTTTAVDDSKVTSDSRITSPHALHDKKDVESFASLLFSAEHKFEEPTKRVKSIPEVEFFTKTQAYADVVAFIMHLNVRIKGKKNDTQHIVSEAVGEIVSILTDMKQWIIEIPPVQQPMRFGNKAYRAWHERLVDNCTAIHERLLPESLLARGVADELNVYLRESFGSSVRIDYGTGHELNFVAWMCCLSKLGVLLDCDSEAMVLDIFTTYLDLMRELQHVYWLEPAGSKGVWGLDDYQFLPFIWGSSQLNVPRAPIRPSDVCDMEKVEAHADMYIYFSAIRFIMKMKTGPFAEHSPLLYDISGVPMWKKVNSGLIKMYHAETLQKFPVVQHFYFGSILRYELAKRPQSHTQQSTASASADSASISTPAPPRVI
jgi:serine/threonine-protein phosphatase 2A activator